MLSWINEKYSDVAISYLGYTMVCPHVRGDNPRSLVRGLSPVQVVDHGKTILYYLHQCRPWTLQNIRVKVGKRGVNMCERVQASQIGFSI